MSAAIDINGMGAGGADGLDALYDRAILDHARATHNRRPLESPTHAAQKSNPLCGDRVAVQLRLGEDGQIAEAAFDGRGCAVSMAAASLLSDLLPGMRRADVERLAAAYQALLRPGTEPSDGAASSGEAVDAALDRLSLFAGVRDYPMRVSCATLALAAFRDALGGAASAAAPARPSKEG